MIWFSFLLRNIFALFSIVRGEAETRNSGGISGKAMVQMFDQSNFPRRPCPGSSWRWMGALILKWVLQVAFIAVFVNLHYRSSWLISVNEEGGEEIEPKDAESCTFRRHVVELLARINSAFQRGNGDRFMVVCDEHMCSRVIRGRRLPEALWYLSSFYHLRGSLWNGTPPAESALNERRWLLHLPVCSLPSLSFLRWWRSLLCSWICTSRYGGTVPAPLYVCLSVCPVVPSDRHWSCSSTLPFYARTFLRQGQFDTANCCIDG